MTIRRNRSMPKDWKLPDNIAYTPSTGLFQRNGKPIGYVRFDGYIELSLGKDRHLYAHRVAWFLVYGYWPDKLDHIKGIKKDNRINQLEEVTTQENMLRYFRRIRNGPQGPS